MLDLVCILQGTSLVLGGIFNSGILATGPKPGAWFDYAPASQDILDQVTALQARAEAVGLTLAEASLQFALNHPAAFVRCYSALERSAHLSAISQQRTKTSLQRPLLS